MKELFANHDAGILGLLIFVAIFAVVVGWIFRPGSSKIYKNYGEIPLKDDTNE